MDNSMAQKYSKLMWNPEAVILLIEEVKSNSLLYDTVDLGYKNKLWRNRVFDKIALSVSSKRPGTTGIEAKKKWNSIRSTFIQELKKVEESKKSGAGADNVYSPCLYYYHLMEFLIPSITIRESVSSQDVDPLLTSKEMKPTTLCTSSSSSFSLSDLCADDADVDEDDDDDEDDDMNGVGCNTEVILSEFKEDIPGPCSGTALSTLPQNAPGTSSTSLKRKLTERELVERAALAAIEHASNIILSRINQKKEDDYITSYVKVLVHKFRMLTEDEFLEAQHTIDTLIYNTIKKRKQ